MRHLKEGRKLNRTSSHRKALLRNLVTSLLEFKKNETTDAKAKELRKVADKMITWGKRGDLHARRQALGVINDSEKEEVGILESSSLEGERGTTLLYQL